MGCVHSVGLWGRAEERGLHEAVPVPASPLFPPLQCLACSLWGLGVLTAHTAALEQIEIM